ncbi:MAG: hypothetical protein AB7S26_38795 [Sandaracinaceae bacterium]
MDRERFPILAEYLEGLPDGLESYPDCESKSSLILSALDGHDRALIADGLPDALAAVVREPPPPGVWMPAVMNDAVFFAVCDRYYPTPEAVHAWTYDRTLAMTKNPLYRTLLRVPGPRVLLRMAARTHGLLQRGTMLAAKSSDSNVHLTLTFPPKLHVGLNLVSNVALWQVVVEVTGGKNVKSRLDRVTDTEAHYVVDFD